MNSNVTKSICVTLIADMKRKLHPPLVFELTSSEPVDVPKRVKKRIKLLLNIIYSVILVTVDELHRTKFWISVEHDSSF
jgi:hypothetical protein